MSRRSVNWRRGASEREADGAMEAQTPAAVD